ncbi:hypothetical protein [Phaeobacter sp. JH20_07]|uniref:hypothetical protein n=1 Tax=Phaeobacter sp. JH20_07 TaxID=3112466 RepID=UPI003A891693
MNTLTTQVASDVENDSLILEVLSEDGECLVIVERLDSDRKLRFQMFTEFLDAACVQEILEIAKKRTSSVRRWNGAVGSKAGFQFQIDFRQQLSPPPFHSMMVGGCTRGEGQLFLVRLRH